MRDVAAGRLDAAQLARNFSDAHPPLTPAQAIVEANRCLFCHDAPCVQACPTAIDVPMFIRKIATGNVAGAAKTILDANILGGSCARVCPTEVLCQQACVREIGEHEPIRIGALQRHAVDFVMARRGVPFTRAASTGRHVAVVGGGPAGLACAHRLALLGHAVVIHEAHGKPGGLNEYGVAAYKIPDGFARREVDFVLAIGGVSVRYGCALGRDITLAALRETFDAVFLAIGLAGNAALGLAAIPGVRPAVDFIADLRQSEPGRIAIGRRVVVVGGGNTAIDAATQARLLGAEDVTIAYRRGPEQMSATPKEQAWAQTNGVRIRHWCRPVGLQAPSGELAAVALERTRMDGAALAGTGEMFSLEADMLLTAIGQTFVAEPLGAGILDMSGGRIAVDAEGRTSLPAVFAGGDCIPGPDLTVQAVADGKRAALAIDRMLRGG